jgi:hypothetical protein
MKTTLSRLTEILIQTCQSYDVTVRRTDCEPLNCLSTLLPDFPAVSAKNIRQLRLKLSAPGKMSKGIPVVKPSIEM